MSRFGSGCEYVPGLMDVHSRPGDLIEAEMINEILGLSLFFVIVVVVAFIVEKVKGGL